MKKKTASPVNVKRRLFTLRLFVQLVVIFMEATPLCLLLNKPHLFSLNTTQVYFDRNDYPYIFVICCGLFLGHPEACKYANHTKEDTTYCIFLICFFLCCTFLFTACVLIFLRIPQVQAATCR